MSYELEVILEIFYNVFLKILKKLIFLEFRIFFLGEEIMIMFRY